LSYTEQQRILQELKTWACLPAVFDMESLPMTEQELQTIGNNPLFDVGVHTITHPSLSMNNVDIQYREIAECKEYLEKKYRKKMHTISYPYGDYNDVTLGIVKEQRLAGAFTTDEWIVTKRTNPVSIGRFQVKNQAGAEFQSQLIQWFRRK
jgi:peptidoglycan/xylan/chitin deacetylase (PgdA/CDA1 family)